MVLLGKLHEVVHTHIIAKPKPLLAHARADLDTESIRKEECNYEIYDREMLGLICALEDQRHFLEEIEFEVVTDHKNMEGGLLCETLIDDRLICHSI